MAEETMQLAADELESALSDKAHESEAEKYLVFRANDIFYGVNIDLVVDIITEISVTYLPMLPPHIQGVINLRGQIVPILDFRILLGQPASEDYCTIVLNVEGTHIGIMTDSVEQIVGIHKEEIHPIPAQQNTQKMVIGMCTMPNSTDTLMVLDCSQFRHA